MEELIEILIRLIASLFEGRAIKRSAQQQNVPIPVKRAEPPSRAPVTDKMPKAKAPPPPRRAARRPTPPKIAVAQPIITRVSNAPATAPIARTIASKAAVAPVASSPSQTAASIRKWLTPATLKNQFLLTEILQPPLALRDVPKPPN